MVSHRYRQAACGDALRQAALGRLAIADGRYADAIARFRESDRLPDGAYNGPCDICIDYPVGIAFERSKMPDSAIARYEHYLMSTEFARLTSVDAFFLAALLPHLGELYEAIGNFSGAERSYLRFVELWRNADPQLQPMVAAARAWEDARRWRACQAVTWRAPPAPTDVDPVFR
jgi:tetratricopeptide (TPR) repeat protein